MYINEVKRDKETLKKISEFQSSIENLVSAADGRRAKTSPCFQDDSRDLSVELAGARARTLSGQVVGASAVTPCAQCGGAGPEAGSRTGHPTLPPWPGPRPLLGPGGGHGSQGTRGSLWFVDPGQRSFPLCLLEFVHPAQELPSLRPSPSASVGWGLSLTGTLPGPVRQRLIPGQPGELQCPARRGAGPSGEQTLLCTCQPVPASG